MLCPVAEEQWAPLVPSRCCCEPRHRNAKVAGGAISVISLTLMPLSASPVTVACLTFADGGGLV